MRHAAFVGACGSLLGVLGGPACTPDVATDPVPAGMQFDSTTVPPRVPSPTNLIVNPATGLIDFSLAGPPIPPDCAAQQTLAQAACELDQYLQTLDGFPTVTAGLAPASANLDPATLTLGHNVVVVDGAGNPVDVAVGFDAASQSVSVKPKRSWIRGQSYWLAVRGYDGGVHTADGGEVVGSPTMSLLKQGSSLTCGAADPTHVDPTCPAVALLSQGRSTADAIQTALDLERARLAYLGAGAWDLIVAAGIPKDEVAVLWGFPIHTTSVAEVNPDADPTLAIVPRVTAANEIHIGVQGPVDPTTVTPFIVKVQSGSVVVVDLDAVSSTPPDLVAGLPAINAQLSGSDIVITANAPFVVGHNYGLFITHDVLDDKGRSLVPSPVSALLTLRGSLVDAGGHSVIAGLDDGDAVTLEAGRAQLGALFDSAVAGITGIARDDLSYCFAFPFGVAP